MQQSIPKLHSVRWKQGGCLVPVRTYRDDVSEECKQVLQDTLNAWAGRHVEGYAVVIWGDAGQVSVSQFSSNDVPAASLPEFVKTTLLLDRAKLWTMETIQRLQR